MNLRGNPSKYRIYRGFRAKSNNPNLVSRLGLSGGKEREFWYNVTMCYFLADGNMQLGDGNALSWMVTGNPHTAVTINCISVAMPLPPPTGHRPVQQSTLSWKRRRQTAWIRKNTSATCWPSCRSALHMIQRRRSTTCCPGPMDYTISATCNVVYWSLTGRGFESLQARGNKVRACQSKSGLFYALQLDSHGFHPILLKSTHSESNGFLCVYDGLWPELSKMSVRDGLWGYVVVN